MTTVNFGYTSTIKNQLLSQDLLKLINRPEQLRHVVALQCSTSGEKGKDAEPVISNLEVKLGRPGILTTKIKRVSRSRAYFHQYATEPPTSNTTWHSESSLLPEFTFNGLTSGRTYWLRVAILSKTGQWIYSPVETRIVQ